MQAEPDVYLVSFEDQIEDDQPSDAERDQATEAETEQAAQMPSPAILDFLRSLPFSASFDGYVGSDDSFSIRTETSFTPTQIGEAIEGIDGVASVCPNLYSPLASGSSGGVTASVAPTSTGNWWRDRINVDDAWAYTNGAPGTVTAVIDSGIQMKINGTYGLGDINGTATISVHPNLAANVFRNLADNDFDNVNDDANQTPYGSFIDDGIGWDFYGDANKINGTLISNPIPDNNPSTDQSKPHGTVVTGILSADGSDNSSVMGVSPDSKFMPLKVAAVWGVFTASGVFLKSVVNAIAYVSMMNGKGYNIRTITGAWAFPPARGGSDPVSQTDLNVLKTEIQSAGAIGITIVLAAQNGGVNLDATNAQGNLLNTLYPMAWNETNVITVAGLAKNEELAINTGLNSNNSDFPTNYGATQVQLGAPGVDINSTTSEQNGWYEATFGSSLAMPMVAGTVSLMLSLKPDLTVSQIRDALRLSVVKVLSAPVNGTTTPLLDKVEWDGRLDVNGAVQYVRNNFMPYTKTVMGDANGNPTNDTFDISKVNSADPNSSTVIKRNGVAYATVSATTALGVFGLGGDDTITIGLNVGNKVYANGGKGNDILRGGSGNDTLIGDVGIDELYGNGGADSLDGSADNDYLSGGTGNDTMIGGKGDDALYGGDNTDKIYGYAGADYLNGGSGDDSLWANISGTSNDGALDILDDMLGNNAVSYWSAEGDTYNGI